MDNIITWGAVSLGSVVTLTATYLLGRMDAGRNIGPQWTVVSDHGTYGLEPVKTFRSKHRAEDHADWLHRERNEITSVMRRDDWRREMIARLENDKHWSGIDRVQRWVTHAAAKLQQVGPPDRSVEERLGGVEARLGALADAVTAEIKLHHVDKDPRTKEFPRPTGGTVVRSPRGDAFRVTQNMAKNR